MSQQSPIPRLLLRPAEVADAIGMSRAKVYELIQSGDIPSIRIGGGSIRVPVDELKAWIVRLTAEQNREPGTDG